MCLNMQGNFVLTAPHGDHILYIHMSVACHWIIMFLSCVLCKVWLCVCIHAGMCLLASTCDSGWVLHFKCMQLQHAGVVSTDVARWALMTRSPLVRFSAEQCAWTCLRGCEAKHHQFVFRQRIPGGRLPSCTCKNVCVVLWVSVTDLVCAVACICLCVNICGSQHFSTTASF